jgi:hypothetical protein
VESVAHRIALELGDVQDAGGRLHPVWSFLDADVCTVSTRLVSPPQNLAPPKKKAKQKSNQREEKRPLPQSKSSQKKMKKTHTHATAPPISPAYPPPRAKVCALPALFGIGVSARRRTREK